MSSALARSALDFATRSHASQRRDSDGAPFIEHPLEVSRLLRDAGCSEELVAAGLLHDLVEDTDVTFADLTGRFGAGVAQLVRAVTDDAGIEAYRPRKQALRKQVRRAGSEAALLFAADKISKVREAPREHRTGRSAVRPSRRARRRYATAPRALPAQPRDAARRRAPPSPGRRIGRRAGSPADRLGRPRAAAPPSVAWRGPRSSPLVLRTLTARQPHGAGSRFEAARFTTC